MSAPIHNNLQFNPLVDLDTIRKDLQDSARQTANRFLKFFGKEKEGLEKTLTEYSGRWITWKKGETKFFSNFQAYLSEEGLKVLLPLTSKRILEREKVFTPKLLLSTNEPPKVIAQLRAKLVKDPTEKEQKENDQLKKSFLLDSHLLQKMYPEMGIKMVEYWDKKNIYTRLLSPLHYGDLYVLGHESHEADQTCKNALFILERILFHLSRLHNEFGYCHRDLKPENILKTKDDWIIIDFGFSIPINTPVPGAGTPTYVDPDQVLPKGEKPVATALTDVWGMGMILLFLVNKNIFAKFFVAQEWLCNNFNRADFSVIGKPFYYTAIEEQRTLLSKGTPLEQLSAKLLNPDPEDRPSLVEISEELERIKAGNG
jgi:hypothetical protein